MGLTRLEPTARAAGIDDRYRNLQRIVRDLRSVVIGFSGGADSALLLKVAVDQLGDRVIAVTAVSPSYPERDRREAVALASAIGGRHLLVDSREFDDPSYLANDGRRCFYCKRELFEILRATAEAHGLAAFAYGAIIDDLGDFRPGMDAAREAGARAPLLEAGFSKDDVRIISRRLGLRTWDRHASACLSSRIPHGTAIDPAELRRVELGEDYLIEAGIRQPRVRAHGAIARIECLAEDMGRFADEAFRRSVCEKLRSLGFRYVTIDLDGYRTGSLNPLAIAPEPRPADPPDPPGLDDPPA